MSNETKVRGPVDVRGILERAGADADAPDGSQAWALAQVDAAVAELIEAAKAFAPHAPTSPREIRLVAALTNVGGAK